MKKHLCLYLLLCLFSSFIYSQSQNEIYQVEQKDFLFNPYKNEGYLQGWNYYFIDKDLIILATFLISNMGPRDLNCGVSVFVQSSKIGSKFRTKEFASKDLVVDKKKFYVKIYNNTMKYKNGKYEIKMHFDKLKLYLNFAPSFYGVSLSGGKFIVEKPDKFVKADIGYSFSKVSGYLDNEGEVIQLNGQGGMEHLNTNHEVYKYSHRWELLRAKNKEGYQVFTGGFWGKKNFPGGFYRTVSVLDTKGKIIFTGKVAKNEIKTNLKDKNSGYKVPNKEILSFANKNKCTLEIIKEKQIGSIDILSNISAFLRFVIRVFFAKPYQLAYFSKVKLDCPDFLPKAFSESRGIQTYYMINHE
ncbi:MAG: hypothetical protein H7A23_14650 [Leptospiraceae bacterium]|nr:hypothetical protein [Leptospiraceae bacterium]MCP5495791.1 hypothetical protein [Leptospiraceae bacterium]